ncbi:MAG: glutathione S-transferase [Rhodobacterales bacterium]|nr:MAG: glutathione S-transferase [Rhodobacterales bacterium]
MTDLSAFPITQRWAPQDASVIQYYGYPTPNGVKVSIALEELGLPYEAHRVTLAEADVKSPAFTSLSPNGKIPAIIDPDGPDGAPIGLFESGAILLYLGEKTGKLLGTTARERHVVTQWLMFQMGGVGPMFGQLGFFYAYGGKDMEDPTARDRYINEAKRLLGVLEGELAQRDWIAGAFSVADIAIAPWLRALDTGYDARGVVGWDDLRHVPAYLDRFLSREAVQRGLAVPER